MKTTLNQKDPYAFLESVSNEQRRKDALAILELMKKITGEAPRMWGDSIIGFGQYHYRYASGREGDFFLTGLSPRKTSLTVYIMSGFSRYGELMKQLGTYKTGKSCLYIKKLSDINLPVLSKLIATSVADMKRMYPSKLSD